jgi:hypothetical protein
MLEGRIDNLKIGRLFFIKQRIINKKPKFLLKLLERGQSSNKTHE